jgi:hypothetical protein
VKASGRSLGVSRDQLVGSELQGDLSRANAEEEEEEAGEELSLREEEEE